VSIDLSESALAQCHGVGGISAPLRAAGCGHGCVCLSAYHFQRERERECIARLFPWDNLTVSVMPLYYFFTSFQGIVQSKNEYAVIVYSPVGYVVPNLSTFCGNQIFLKDVLTTHPNIMNKW